MSLTNINPSPGTLCHRCAQPHCSVAVSRLSEYLCPSVTSHLERIIGLCDLNDKSFSFCFNDGCSIKNDVLVWLLLFFLFVIGLSVTDLVYFYLKG